MTSYPNAEDYIRAVQRPGQAFRRPEMQNASVAVHPRWGIPFPISGSAAVVFRANVEERDTALRFFIREDASSRDRYNMLGQHFVERNLEDCVAHPSWEDDAIFIRDSMWPMVRMPWVDGTTLDVCVERLATAGDGGALISLARKWRRLIGRLQTADFAHGDLEHGNVMVDGSGTLRLVDFDGSWVEAFDSAPPPREIGHRNYQQEGRKWGRWMDTFPALVIYAALLILSRSPMAWAHLSTGENILFTADDFRPPFRTRTWEVVDAIDDNAVRHVAERLKRECLPDVVTRGPLESILGRDVINLEYPGVPRQRLRKNWWS